MKTKSVLILTALFIVSGIFLLSQDRVILKIGEGMPAYPLAIPKFITHDSSAEVKTAAEELYQIVLADLKYSRMFDPIPESYYSYIRSLDPEEIFFKEWESIQAQILFVGEISQGEGKNIIFDGKLYDVKAGERITGKRYTGDSSLNRLMAHRMSDEVLKMFGETPIFQSKIAFISDRPPYVLNDIFRIPKRLERNLFRVKWGHVANRIYLDRRESLFNVITSPLCSPFGILM